MGKPVFMMFNSDVEADIFESKIIDGCVSYKDKVFYIGKATPIKVRRLKGGYDLYLLEWSSPVPSKQNRIKIGTKENPIKTKQVNPEFSKMQVVTPEMLRKIMNMKIFGNLIPTKQSLSPILLLVLGVVLGVAILYLLMYFKVLRF